MTRWVTWLLAWLAVIGLSWNLRGQAGNISHDISSVSLSSHTVLCTFGVILSTSPPDIHTRVAALELSALPRACLPNGDGAPPWLDTRGPAIGASPWVLGTAAGQAGSSGERLGVRSTRIFPAWTGLTNMTAFCNSL